jgi:hypothetical protein
MSNIEKPDVSVEPTPKKRGPKPSGVPRKDVYKAATKNRRDRLLDSGKVEVKWFIDPRTKAALERSKVALGLGSKTPMGEVLDALMQQLENKSK